MYKAKSQQSLKTQKRENCTTAKHMNPIFLFYLFIHFMSCFRIKICFSDSKCRGDYGSLIEQSSTEQSVKFQITDKQFKFESNHRQINYNQTFLLSSPFNTPAFFSLLQFHLNCTKETNRDKYLKHLNEFLQQIVQAHH